jgi:hypothetical protein
MTALMYTVGVLLFAVGVAASIGLHELGHLIPGKLFNVKVTQFFVGFGQTLWSRQKGETEYGVKAIPLGGYCKLVGMLPPEPDQDPDKVRDTRTGMFAQLVSDARSAEWELVEEGDHDRLFYKKPWWQRVIIMGSGVMINLVLAFLLFAVVFMGYGVQQPTTTVDTVSQCVIAVTEANRDQPPRDCTDADPVSPAQKAGSCRSTEPVWRAGPSSSTWSAPTATSRPTWWWCETGTSSPCAPPRSSRRGWTRTTPNASPRSGSSESRRRADSSRRARATWSVRWPTGPGRPCRPSVRCR